jgi:2-polyprenyl-6-hydroxyphenyl methylase/3-demethylubiquinone-9 3-methyltransferase
MTSFIPEGVAGAFFELVGRYAPPPTAGALPPLMWGNEPHVRELFGDRVALEVTRRHYTERAASPEAYRDLFNETFGPVIAIRASLADDPDRAVQFDRDFLDFAVRSNSGAASGSAEYCYDYLMVVARRLR